MTFHLSHEQLCDLVVADLSSQDFCDSLHIVRTYSSVVEEHLRACPVCSAELRSLRDSLGHYRDASIAYSRQQLAQTGLHWSSIAPAPHRYLSQPLYWAAAALTIVAALFPLNMHRHSAVAPSIARAGVSSPAAAGATTESDEDLLADIDQKVDADVPSPLEPLADPTATTTETSSDQRKN